MYKDPYVWCILVLKNRETRKCLGCFDGRLRMCLRSYTLISAVLDNPKAKKQDHLRRTAGEPVKPEISEILKLTDPFNSMLRQVLAE